MPTALVTGAPDRVSDIAIALKSAGFDILATGSTTAEDEPGLPPQSVDCWLQLPEDQPRSAGGPLRRTGGLIARDVLPRFDATARLLPLLAPGANVLVVMDRPAPADREGPALRTMLGLLARAVETDGRRAGLRATVVAEDLAPLELAALATRRPPGPLPWAEYADIDPGSGFADWRASVLCLASLGAGAFASG